MHFAFYHCRALTFKWFFIFRVFFINVFMIFVSVSVVFRTLSLHSVRLRLRSRRRPCLRIISANWQHRSFHCTDLLFNYYFSAGPHATRNNMIPLCFVFFFFSSSLSVSLFRSLLGWLYFFCAVERWNCAALPGQQCFFYPTVPHIHAQTELLPRGLRLAINSIIIYFWCLTQWFIALILM